MVSLVVGFPGSGKSYYAIDKIYNILTNNDDMSKHIDIIYTNINGVKFDYFPDSKIEFKKFDIDAFYIYLKKLHNLYELHKNKDDVDQYLIDFTNEEGYYNALFVFDECHSFFENQDKIKVFWLTYHRHVHHEIILLTQNKTLIHSKYRAIPEIFIEAQPRSKKIFGNTLKYKGYASFAMRKSDKFKEFSITTKEEVFKLYKSGNKSNQKSIITRLIYILMILFVVLSLLSFLIMTMFSVEEKPNEIKSNSNDNISTVEAVEIDKTDNLQTKPLTPELKVFKFLCDSKLGCTLFDSTYSVHYVNKFIHETESKKINMDYIFFDYKTKHKIFYYYVLSNENILKKYFYIPDYIINKDEKKDINLTDSFEGVKL